MKRTKDPKIQDQYTLGVQQDQISHQDQDIQDQPHQDIQDQQHQDIQGSQFHPDIQPSKRR